MKKKAQKQQRLSMKFLWQNSTNYLGDEQAHKFSKANDVNPLQRGIVISEYFKYLEEQMKPLKP